MAGPVSECINHFLRVALEEPSAPAYRDATRLARAGVFDALVDQLEPLGQVDVDTDYNINPACVYRVRAEPYSFSVYLSTVLPYAAVTVSSNERRFEGFLSDFLAESWAADLATLVQSWGFLVLPSEVCRAPSIIRDPDTGEVQSFFEALFEYEVDPPWDWDFRLDLGLAEGEYPSDVRGVDDP